MENIRQYLLTVITVALLCGIINGIIGKNGAYGTIVKFVSSLILVLTVISPWAKIQLEDISLYTEEITNKAKQIALDGNAMASMQSEAIIKSEVETYILDKAASMGLCINVEVKLRDSVPQVPYAVQITGNASPYLKQKLEALITNDLGISEDEQSWI